MATTVLKAEILKFPQIKLIQIQRESLLFQCKISNIQYLGRSTAITQQSTFMRNVESDIVVLLLFNYEELHVLQELF